MSGQYTSPGGFVFGVQGWTWGEQRPSSITFMLDGTAKVSDQHGRPIKGVVKDGKPVYFDKCTHAQVVAALVEERIDWTKLRFAGWPQLPYDELMKLPQMPPWPFNPEHTAMTTTGAKCTCIMCSVRDPQIRKDALRLRHEQDQQREREMSAAMAEAEK